DEQRAARAAQLAGDRLVLGQQAGLPVHHEQHRVRLGDRRARVGLHRRVEVLALPVAIRERLEPGGVDDQHPALADLHLLDDAIAREAGVVVDQRAAAAGLVVEQRGLADVGPAHDGDDRQRSGRHGDGGGSRRDRAGNPRRLRIQGWKGTEFLDNRARAQVGSRAGSRGSGLPGGRAARSCGSAAIARPALSSARWRIKETAVTGLARRLRNAVLVPVLALPLLMVAPGPAQATTATIKRSLQNLLLFPVDLALSPYVATRTVYRQWQTSGDSDAVRIAYPLPGVAWATSVNMGASLLRGVAGAL